MRNRTSVRHGIPVSSASPRAITSDWLNPLCRFLEAWRGIGIISCIPQSLICFPNCRASSAAKILPQILRETGLEVLDIPTYKLEGEEEGGILPKLDFLTFSSASGVRWFFREYQELPAGTKAVCIGRITAMEFQKHSRQPYWLAKEISAKGLVMTIVQICLSK